VSYALLFAGQGNQHADMLPWLAADASGSRALSALEEILQAPWRSIAANESLRNANRFAQPLITATSLASWEMLKSHLPVLPAAVAGYSVGEMAAYACAGVLTSSQAIELSCVRADLMDQAAIGKPSGLMSVSGLPVEQVLRNHPDLHCAIAIDVDHAILGALTYQLDEAQRQLDSAGASCKRLEIAMASHTSLMASASKGFSMALATTDLQPPNFPVVVNARSRLCRRVDALRQALSDQICDGVDWASCMDALAEVGVRCVLEIGPGHALSAMWNRRHPTVPARALEDFKDPRGAAQWVARSSNEFPT
jgi:[acyl-carrier-protein] S-malonyltransferase